MPFCSCALKKKNSVRIWQLEAFEEWWQWGKQLLQALKKMPLEATEETQEKVSLEVCLWTRSFQKSKEKQHAMSYQQSSRRDEYSGQFLWLSHLVACCDRAFYVIRDVLAFAEFFRRRPLAIGKATMNPFYLEFDGLVRISLPTRLGHR